MSARPFRASLWADGQSPGSSWVGDVGTYGSLDAARRAARKVLTEIEGGWTIRHGSTVKITRRDGVPGSERWGWPEGTTPKDLMGTDPQLLTDPMPDPPKETP